MLKVILFDVVDSLVVKTVGCVYFIVVATNVPQALLGKRNVADKVNCYYENNQQDALYRLIYYSKSALHVSGDVFAHHQEH
jgi:hypothetical protein